MEAHLTPDQKAFVRQAIESGRLQREEDAIQEALALWEARERSRAEILTAVDAAEASLAAGKGRVITDQSMRNLAADGASPCPGSRSRSSRHLVLRRTGEWEH